MTALRRTRQGMTVSFDDVEASLLRHLAGSVREMLGPPATVGPGGSAAAAAGRPGPDDSAGPSGPVPTVAELSSITGLGGPDGTSDSIDGPAAAPVDPVLARLLPDGYRDDPESAGEFRRLTEDTVRRQKSAAVERLLADLPAGGGGEIRLTGETVEAWLAALNDVRLMLGTRLDVTEDMPEPDPDDPDAAPYVVYLWLTELQELLVAVAGEAEG